MKVAAACTLLSLPWAASAVIDCVGTSLGQVQTSLWYVQNCAGSSLYDKNLWPTAGTGNATEVQLQLTMTQMDDVEEKKGQVTIGGYFRMQWTDPRLAYNASSFPTGVNLKNYKARDIIWVPDIYVDNMVESVSGGDSADLFSISPDGVVYRSYEVLWTIKCTLALGKLPFDEQNCAVILGSYSESQSIVRVMAFGGAVGPGTSGIGVKAAPMTSVVWEIPGEDGDGFQTPGMVKDNCFSSGCWDVLSLTFSFSRKPTYYIRQVLLPDALFLGVSYTGFYVDPGAAPARAAVAVIPLLIMLTLLNNVYNTLPKTSERMWLTDYLLVSLFFSSFAAVEFAFAQLLLNMEKKRAANLERLRAVEKQALAIAQEARAKNKAMLDLLKDYETEEVDMERAEGEQPPPKRLSHRLMGKKAPAEAEGGQLKGRRRSAEAQEHNMSEANLGVIEYARDIFEHYDDDGSGSLGPHEIRPVLAYFNIYLTAKNTATVVCMFMRDKGETTPLDESKVVMKFALFVELLMEVRKYLLKVSRHESCLAHFWSSPPSLRLDMTWRVLFPVMVVLKIVIMLASISTY